MINEFAQWLMDLLLWLPRKIMSMLVDAFLSLISSIPVPDAITNLSGSMGNFPQMTVFMADAFEIKYGIGVIASAYLARFILRRIPFIGG